MRGVVTLMDGRVAPGKFLGAERALRFDTLAQFGGVSAREQPRDRNPHEFRIAEKPRTVGVSDFHRLDHEMRTLDRGGAENGKIVALKDVQDLDEMNAARRRPRHRENLVA